jgi:hypothetical protein
VQIEAAEASTDPQGIAHAQSKVVLSFVPIICFPPKFSGADPILTLDLGLPKESSDPFDRLDRAAE